ncbi:GATA zinc finger domain-containing protein 14-like [Cotesia glomerata]|uniref:GATA zinc finger domain-containing protein 14-like n=1 Tax=Cotesia glomerata TaxID=32391 RepID=UPI001D01AFF6|nr:GATA zinc finger domain-containing protein 14-like [Cotesia glomerata]
MSLHTMRATPTVFPTAATATATALGSDIVPGISNNLGTEVIPKTTRAVLGTDIVSGTESVIGTRTGILPAAFASLLPTNLMSSTRISSPHSLYSNSTLSTVKSIIKDNDNINDNCNNINVNNNNVSNELRQSTVGNGKTVLPTANVNIEGVQQLSNLNPSNIVNNNDNDNIGNNNDNNNNNNNNSEDVNRDPIQSMIQQLWYLRGFEYFLNQRQHQYGNM